MYNHEEYCTVVDCPLKRYKRYLDQGQQVFKNSADKTHLLGSKI